MQARAKAMLRIAKLIEALVPDDQRVVAYEVYRTYGRPLTGAQRQLLYRQRHALVTDETPPEHNECVIARNEAAVTTASLPTVVSSKSLSSKNQELRHQATEVLGFLNTKTGRSYRFIDTNLRLIEARLKSGATVQDCKGVIARKARKWLTDPKMNEYLRPATLFNATNFEQYLGENSRDPEGQG